MSLPCCTAPIPQKLHALKGNPPLSLVTTDFSNYKLLTFMSVKSHSSRSCYLTSPVANNYPSSCYVVCFYLVLEFPQSYRWIERQSITTSSHLSTFHLVPVKLLHCISLTLVIWHVYKSTGRWYSPGVFNLWLLSHVWLLSVFFWSFLLVRFFLTMFVNGSDVRLFTIHSQLIDPIGWLL